MSEARSEETSEANRTTLYPAIEPYRYDWVDASDGHEIHTSILREVWERRRQSCNIRVSNTVNSN